MISDFVCLDTIFIWGWGIVCLIDDSTNNMVSLGILANGSGKKSWI